MNITLNKKRLRFDLRQTRDNPIQPTTAYVSDSLLITNTSSEALAFKVKTNHQALYRYIVIPNAGVINSNGDVKVKISMLPSASLPAVEQPSKDKFLLNLAPIPPQQLDRVADFWKRNETKPSVRELRFSVDLITTDQSQDELDEKLSTEADHTEGEDIEDEDKMEQVKEEGNGKEDKMDVQKGEKENLLGANINVIQQQQQQQLVQPTQHQSPTGPRQYNRSTASTKEVTHWSRRICCFAPPSAR